MRTALREVFSMRMIVRVLVTAALVAGFGGLANAQNETNKDRPGNDFSVQDIGNNPALCAQNCSALANCRAWTFVKPGVQGPSAKCYLKNPIPSQVNNNCCTSGVKLTGPVPAGAAVGADRPGSDIVGSNLATPNPTLCKNLCDGNANCKAWTFVKPGIQGPQARCYLKNPVPAQVANSCCISGVKLPPPPAPIPPGATANQDRPGSDFNNIALAVADPALCQNACNGVAQCKAWTYVKPGVQGPNARCYLKNAVPAAVVNNCCVSGVKPAAYFLPPGATNNRDRPGNDYSNFAVADPT
ncbi:MAG TPA: PAN domain-containing protein, partial [Alphaproteobacteria bacterium]